MQDWRVFSLMRTRTGETDLPYRSVLFVFGLLTVAGCQTSPQTETRPGSSALARQDLSGLSPASLSPDYSRLSGGKMIYRSDNGTQAYMFNMCEVSAYRPVLKNRCERRGNQSCKLAVLDDRDVAALPEPDKDRLVAEYERLLRAGDPSVSRLSIATLPMSSLMEGSDIIGLASVRLANRTACAGDLRITFENNSVCDGSWQFEETETQVELQPILMGSFQTVCKSGGSVKGRFYMSDVTDGVIQGTAGAGRFRAMIGPAWAPRSGSAAIFDDIWKRRMSYGGFEKISELQLKD